MLPLLMLIPGIFWTATKFVGSIAENHITLLGPLLEKLLSNSPTGAAIADLFESVTGKLDQDKKNQFTLELDSLLGQIEIDNTEAQSESWFKSCWRPYLAWGLSTIIIVHGVIFEVYNILHLPPPNPLEPMVLTLMGGLLGLYMGARTLEKRSNSN